MLWLCGFSLVLSPVGIIIVLLLGVLNAFVYTRNRLPTVNIKEVNEMDVILLDKLGKLGDLGDKVTVKAGYGRNYLVPYGLAVPATKENVEAFETRRAELESQAALRKAEAENRAQQLSEIELSLVAKAGDEGKLFGSIGPRDLADAIASAGIDVAKSEVRMPEGPLRQTGEYDIALQLHPEVAASVRVVVTAE